MKLRLHQPLPPAAAYAATLTIILVGDAVHALTTRRKPLPAHYRFTLRARPGPHEPRVNHPDAGGARPLHPTTENHP